MQGNLLYLFYLLRCLNHENSQATDFNKHEKKQIFYTQIFFYRCRVLLFVVFWLADYEVIILYLIDKLSHEDNIYYLCTTPRGGLSASIKSRRCYNVKDFHDVNAVAMMRFHSPY